MHLMHGPQLWGQPHSVNIVIGRKPEFPGKPPTLGKALTYSSHMNVLHECEARMEAMICVKALSLHDDCPTKVP